LREIIYLICDKLGIYKNGIWNYLELYKIFLVFFVLLLLFYLFIKIRKMAKIIEKSEEKNRENLLFIRNVINNSPSMYSVKDRYGEVFLANKSYSEFFGKNINEVEGKTVKELFDELNYDIELSRQMNRDEIEVIKTRKEKLGIEEKMVLPSGEEKWFYSNIVPLKMDLGLYYSLRVSTDITQRKIVEIALKEAKLDAEKRSIEKGHFLASMSHEIRTPLNGIITMLEQINLKDDKELYFIQKEIEIMNISTKRLVEVIDDVMNLSKIEYGEIKPEVDEFDIRLEIKNSILLFGEKIKEKKIEILTYFDKTIPSLIKGDLVKYHHVITNIFGNALKYTKEGHILIELKLLSKEDNKIVIRTIVKDTGIGIAKENHMDIFKKFSQVENNLKGTNGVGLGLAIAKELLDRMGGNITLQSEKNDGSIFIIDIPFVTSKENILLRIKEKELIILSDKMEYMDNYIKNVKNIEGLNFIIVDDVKEFYTVIEEKETKDCFVLVDIDKYDRDMESLYNSFESQIIFIKNERIPSFVNEKVIISRAFLEEGLKDFFGLAKEKNEEKNLVIKEYSDQILKILLVEDDLINREAFKILLESMGITNLYFAVDGEEALEYFQKDSYDLIFMDLQLPKLDGFEVLEKIREFEEKNDIEKTYIITLTANALEGFREKCIDAGFDDYLTKPISREKLFQKIDYFLNSKRDSFEDLKMEYYDNGEILKKLFKSFIENIPQLIDETENAFESGNREELLQKLHKLKGAVGNLREENLVKIIETMEFKGKNEENIESLYKKFLKELNFLIKQIKKEI